MSNEAITNFCKDGGSGMSECSVAGQDYKSQKKCSFCKKSTGHNRCRFEIFGEYCDRVTAQKHAKGQPIMLSDVNGYENPCKDPESLWGDIKEIVDEVMGEPRPFVTKDETQSVKDIHNAWKEQQDTEKIYSIVKSRNKCEDLQFVDRLIHHNHCKDYSEEIFQHDHGHALVFKTRHESPVQFQKLSDRESKAVCEHEQIHDRFSYIQVLDYIKSRRLNVSAIMERYQENLIIVIPVDKVLSHWKSKFDKLLLDVEYLILYDPHGEIDIHATEDFLYYKAYMWRKLIPKDALPKFADFGSRKAIVSTAVDNSGSLKPEEMYEFSHEIAKCTNAHIEEVEFSFDSRNPCLRCELGLSNSCNGKCLAKLSHEKGRI